MLSKLKQSTIIASVLTGLAIAPGAQASDAGVQWSGWMEAAGYLSNGRDRGEVVLFQPLGQSSDSLIFADVRGKLFADDIREGNFALGYREIYNESWIVGGWVGFDHRRSQFDNTFNQLAGGLELLGADYDFRLNTYLPLSDAKSTSSGAQLQFSGTQLFIVGGQETPMKGVDAEVGFRLPLEDLGMPDNHEARVFLGGYYFDDSAIPRAVAGPRLRGEMRMFDLSFLGDGSRLTFEAEYQYDRVRDNQAELGLRVRIPLFADSPSAHAGLDPLTRRMTEGLERDTDIVTAPSSAEAVLDGVTGTPLNRFVSLDATGNLLMTLATAGPNTLVIVDGGAGSVAASAPVQPDQTLAGGGSTLLVRGAQSGTLFAAPLPGSQPTLIGCGCIDLLGFGGNNIHITGLILDGDSGTSDHGIITAAGATNIAATNLMIRGMSVAGIGLDDNNVALIDNVTVENGTGVGIGAFNNNQITIRNSTFRNLAGHGVAIVDNNIVLAQNNMMSNLGQSGFILNDGNQLVVTNSTLSTIFDRAFLLDDNNQVAIVSSTITAVGEGFNADENNRIATSNTRFENVGDDVFDVDANTELVVQNTTFAGIVGDDIFDFENGGSSFSATSTGNVNITTTVGGMVCDADGGAFTGTLTFADGVTLTDNIAPCN